MKSVVPRAYVVAVTMGYGHLRPAYAQFGNMGVSCMLPAGSKNTP